jgi:hypothetical protein
LVTFKVTHAFAIKQEHYHGNVWKLVQVSYIAKIHDSPIIECMKVVSCEILG